MTFGKFKTNKGPKGHDNYLIGESANLLYFLKGPFTEAGKNNGVDKTLTIKAHKRGAYPGDPFPANIPQTSRRYHRTRDRAGTAIPGRNCWFVDETPQEDGGGPTQVRQFTYTGTFLDLMNYCTANCKITFFLRNESGAGETIEHVTGAP